MASSKSSKDDIQGIISGIEKGYGICTMQLEKNCARNKGVRPVTEFYTASNSSLFRVGHFCICKKCLKQYLYNGDSIDMPRFKKILRIFDLPFIQSQFEGALRDKKETVGSYLRLLGMNMSKMGRTSWEDSDEFIEGYKEPIVINTPAPVTVNNSVSREYEVTEDLIDKWGTNLTPDDYRWLEKKYDYWIKGIGGEVDITLEDAIIDICYISLQIKQTREKGDDTSKLEGLKNAKIKLNGLTVKDRASLAEADASKILGVRIQEIETKRPCEYFEDKNVYEDYDGFYYYWKRFILRPLKNLLTGSRDFDSEFSIEDKVGLDNIPSTPTKTEDKKV